MVHYPPLYGTYPQGLCEAPDSKPFETLKEILAVPQTPEPELLILRPGTNRHLDAVLADVNKTGSPDGLVRYLEGGESLLHLVAQLDEQLPPFHQYGVWLQSNVVRHCLA